MAINDQSSRVSNYLEYLPAILQADPFVGQFLLAFERILSGFSSADLQAPIQEQPGLEQYIDSIYTYFNPVTKQGSDTAPSVKSPVHPVEELQAAIGNREMGQYIQSQSNHRSSPLPHELTLPSKITPIQAKPQFRGLSSELIAASSRLTIQPKLTIGEPGDKYEQEADRVAAEVVNRINTPDSQPSSQGQPIQRKADTEEDDELQMKAEAGAIQRVEMPQEDEELQMKLLPDWIQRVEMSQEELQMKPAIQPAGTSGLATSAGLESAINQARGGGQPLADSIRQPMEQAFGTDFSDIKVHTDGQSNQLSRSINARAFTTKNDIFFKQGEYNPGTRQGQELLAHELTHVVQQSGSHFPVSQPQIQRNGNKNLVRKAGDNQEVDEAQDLEAVFDETTKNHSVAKARLLFLNGKKVTGVWHTPLPEIPKSFIKKKLVGSTKSEEIATLVNQYNQIVSISFKEREDKLKEIVKSIEEWQWNNSNQEDKKVDKVPFFNALYNLVVNSSQFEVRNDESRLKEILNLEEGEGEAIKAIRDSDKIKEFKKWLEKFGYIVVGIEGNKKLTQKGLEKLGYTKTIQSSYQRWLKSTSIEKALMLYKKYQENQEPEPGPFVNLNAKLSSKDTASSRIVKTVRDTTTRHDELYEYYGMPEDILGEEGEFAEMEEMGEVANESTGGKIGLLTKDDRKELENKSSAVASDILQGQMGRTLGEVKNTVKNNIFDIVIKGPVGIIMDKITGLLEGLSIGHFIKAIQYAKQAKKIHKQVKIYNDAAREEQSEVTEAAGYAAAKRQRGCFESFFLAILRGFQGICRFLSLVTPAGSITEIMKFTASMIEKGVKVLHALKAVVKRVKGTQGRNRRIFAEVIVDKALTGDKTALKLIYNLFFKTSKMIPKSYKWVAELIIANLAEQKYQPSTTGAKVKYYIAETLFNVDEQIHKVLKVISETETGKEVIQTIKKFIKDKKITSLKTLDKAVAKTLVANITELMILPEYELFHEQIIKVFGEYPFLKSLLLSDLMEQMKSTPGI